MKAFGILTLILGCASVFAQSTDVPGLGRYQPAPETRAPIPEQPRPPVQPENTRGIEVVSDSQESVPTERSSIVTIGKPETMKLLDNTKHIKLGDKLEYMVAEDREPPIVIFVAEDGRVDVPLAGKINASGKTAQELAIEISKELEKDYYYQATVHVAEYRGARTRGEVFVMGQVLSQGMVQIPQNEVMTISRAILTAGGFAPRADTTRVTVIRRDQEDPTSEKRIEVNVSDILENGQLDKDLVLQPNDLIFVAPKGDTSGSFTISGAVRAPGTFPIAANQQLYLSQAILQAGGFTEFGKGSSVKLIRHDEDGTRHEQSVNVDKVLQEGIREDDVLVQPGDMIIVGEKWITF